MSSLIQINPASATGKQYWRSLNELAATPEFRDWAEREFGDGASEMLGSASRRSLLKLMAASFGLAGMAACRRPVENILPHSKGIEGYVHGRPLHYATALTVGGAATGLIVRCNDGRPTKIEGNPRHPYSLGATTALMQAALLNVYDPDRAKAPRKGEATTTWAEFAAFAKDHFTSAKLGEGDGLRIVTERSSSPSLAATRAELLKKFPKAKWIEYDSVNFDAPRLGSLMAFGLPLEPLYRFDKADVVLALDADFLGLDSPTIQPVKQFTTRRRVSDPKDEINRLYVAEANYTITGATADHRLRVRASDIGAFALALAKELNVSGGELKVLGNQTGAEKKFLTAVAKDLAAHKGKAVVVAGPRQPAAVHALVALINQTLGNGETVTYANPIVDSADSIARVKELGLDLATGRVNTLVVLGGNPAYTMPADVDFAKALGKVATTIALVPEENETWNAVTWRLPEVNPLECWGDARALDGTLSVQQPMIDPLYDARSVLEVAAMIAGSATTKPYEIVRNTIIGAWPAAERERRWREALHEGLIPGSAFAPAKAAANIKAVWSVVEAGLQKAVQGTEVLFVPSSHAWDGRFANNGWMQEVPDPLTKLVWENAALLSPKTAKALSIVDGDMLSLSHGHAEIEMPAMILPGHADNSISVALGHGRSACGRIGQGTGHRAEGLRTTTAFHIVSDVVVRKTGATWELVTTQEHHTMEGRPIVREASLEHYREHPEFVEHAEHLPEMITMFPDFDYANGNQWGMTIDLHACIGCNACTIACVAENNIPIVGKEQVRRGREMHWIRLDRYFNGDMDDPQVVTQPMACQQCERAPCESVCPVAATVHSPEGLNEMAYNRCVGTRYCSNNCPYKVRRFNFLNFHKHIQETEKMVFNPDVTVRMRGVMEKCTYCVQRIQTAKIDAKADGRRPIKDGEIVTACQQVCPADAIIFGNINDPESRVARAKKSNRDYKLLEELNTRPRTTYLGKIRNPNPELV
jgi:MoCo/4Fe-4S cofactor protein with predicted Tat translocation signal